MERAHKTAQSSGSGRCDLRTRCGRHTASSGATHICAGAPQMICADCLVNGLCAVQRPLPNCSAPPCHLINLLIKVMPHHHHSAPRCRWRPGQTIACPCHAEIKAHWHAANLSGECTGPRTKLHTSPTTRGGSAAENFMSSRATMTSRASIKAQARSARTHCKIRRGSRSGGRLSEKRNTTPGRAHK